MTDADAATRAAAEAIHDELMSGGRHGTAWESDEALARAAVAAARPHIEAYVIARSPAGRARERANRVAVEMEDTRDAALAERDAARADADRLAAALRAEVRVLGQRDDQEPMTAAEVGALWKRLSAALARHEDTA